MRTNVLFIEWAGLIQVALEALDEISGKLRVQKGALYMLPNLNKCLNLIDLAWLPGLAWH